MDLSQLRTALLAGESDTTFTFDPANPAFAGPEWADVRDFVATKVGTGKLVVTGFDKPPSDVAVVYAGTVAALLPQQDPVFGQAPLTVTSVFWLRSGIPQLTASADPLPADWTIPKSVSGTADTVLGEVTYTSAAITSSSSDGTEPFSGRVVTRGTSMDGVVAEAGLFAPVWPLVVAPSGVTVTGPMELAAGAAPVLTLSATPSADTSMRPFPFDVALGAFLASTVATMRSPAGPVPVQFVEAGLAGVIRVGSGDGAFSVPVRLVLASGDSSLVTLEVLETVVPIPSWAALAPLTGYADLNSYLPEQAPPSGQLVLNRLVVSIDPSAPVTELVKHLSLDLSLNPGTPWVILPNGILSVAELGAAFSLISPAGFTPEVTMYGVFRFGTTDYRLAVTVPSLVVTGALANDTTVPLSDLADQFIQTVVGGTWLPPFPSMTVYELDVTASPLTKQYSINAAIDFGWSLEFADFAATFETLTFAVSYDGAALSSEIAGNFALRLLDDVTELYGAAATPGDGTWSLVAGTAQGSTIDLVTVVKLLLSAAVDPSSYDLGSLRLTDIEMAVDLAPAALVSGDAGGGTQVVR
jgi:hypothetical protein